MAAMRIRWYGQSAFRLEARDGTAVFLDPFGTPGEAARFRFAYPPIRDVRADLLLITHEHFDHNAAEAVGGSPRQIRSTAGTFRDTPVGQVVAVASEHDDAAGTQRGPNTIFVFHLDGLRVCHFGDFGQRELRPEQAQAIGRVDVLLLPVGGGPTIGPDVAEAVTRRLRPRWVVPMHYRTPAVEFLPEPAEAFARRFRDVRRLDRPEVDFASLAGPGAGEDTAVVLPAVPAA
jgi:L-ascorbate metabolism protein UlaG (beta-lactamase superfamily)